MTDLNQELNERLHHIQDIESLAQYLLENKDTINTICFQIKRDFIGGEEAVYDYIGSYYSAVGLMALGTERIKDVEYISDQENGEKA